MSTCNQAGSPAAAQSTTPCDCDHCRSGDLAVRPFESLRVAYGMLLGEDDFAALMGNPRGKQMIHSAWLHGPGVVWGLGVRVSGTRNLEILPGLALDGIGRELHNAATACLDVRDFVGDSTGAGDKDCSTRTLDACLVAEFDTCLANAVPTLADPCDVTRQHDDYSRVVERVRFTLVPDCCPCCRRPEYHRVRVLLGLDQVDSEDDAGEQAIAARDRVLAVPAAQRPAALVEEFRVLSALDSIDRRPVHDGSDCGCDGVFPVSEDRVGVPLACVRIRVVSRDGCDEIEIVEVDPTVRCALLPTATIQELCCGLAPALLTTGESGVDEGPRVDHQHAELSDGGRRLTIPVTAPLARGSVSPTCVAITSLSLTNATGWVVEDIYEIGYQGAEQAIVVHLADRPVNDLVRVLVRGTGPRPVMGSDPPVPLAGLVGGPPATGIDGHDAVWTITNTFAQTVPADTAEPAESKDPTGSKDPAAPADSKEE